MLKPYETEWENIMDLRDEFDLDHGECPICLTREEFDEYIFEDGEDFMINIKFKDGSTYTFYDEIAYDTYHKVEHVREFYPDGRVYIQLVPYIEYGKVISCTFWFTCIA